VDRDAGTITLDDSTGYVDTDFLFQIGDANNNGARPSKLVGLDGWLPETKTATLFFGVDRTADATRLGGVFYDADAASDNTEDGLVNAGARLFTEGGRPDVVMVNPIRLAILDRLLEARGNYEKVDSVDADVGFDSIRIHTGGGTVRVVGDPWCPKNVGYMLQRDTWSLCSVGEAPQILTHDGMRVLRNAAADSIEVRAGYYANLACSAPGWNCRIKFGAT